MSTTSPNMSLVVPTVGVTNFPEWANDLNADLSILDQHNHSIGQGVQIQPNGMNINSDLPFNGNNATLLRATRYSPQNSPITNTGLDVGETYVSGNELYYNDVTGGNQIQITNNGSVNAGAGSITGLPSGTASASYSAGTFVWQSATNTAANMDAGSYIFRNSGANSHSLTLQPPSAMAANIVETLPAIPGAQSFMTIDASGNMAAYAPINQGISKSNLVPLGQQVSSSCGTFTTTSQSSVAVTNLSVSITTSGRPVFVGLIEDGSLSSIIQISTISGTAFSNTSFLGFLRAGSLITLSEFGSGNDATAARPELLLSAGSFWYIDVVGAGTYIYSVKVNTVASNIQLLIQNIQLIAYEL